MTDEETKITFKGDHIHDMKKDHCTICGKTHEQIVEGIEF